MAELRLAQLSLILRLLLSTSASQAHCMEGAYGTKQSFNDLQILEVPHKSWNLQVSGAPSFHTRRKEGWRRKQNKTLFFFCVKEVSISFGREKMFFRL